MKLINDRCMNSVCLGLGSNLSPRHDYLERARSLIGEQVGAILQASSIIETAPWGFASKNAFLNQIIVVETQLDPLACLDVTQAIEMALGRTSKSNGITYADRCIDIDLLLWNINETVLHPRLVIPHALIQERMFIIKHLKELNIKY